MPKYIRFISEDHKEHFGIPTNDELNVAKELKNNPLLNPGDFTETGTELKVVKLLSPIRKEDVSSVICVGLNYIKHWEELSAKLGIPCPTVPALFMKPKSTITDPNSVIQIPSHVDLGDPGLDYECELVIVIGRECRNVKANDALQYVHGYTAANDVSNRFWQNKAGGRQWIRGKSYDTFCPLGPTLVTGEDINPQDLKIQTFLDGRLMQNGHTSDMIFTIGQILEWVSTDTTLPVGTCILTGTPSGVGAPQGVWMKPGSRVEVRLEGVGSLHNTVQQAPVERTPRLEYIPETPIVKRVVQPGKGSLLTYGPLIAAAAAFAFFVKRQ